MDPHPLSTLKTELVWDGKYDEYGNRREVDIAGSAMPLQKIETVDEPRARTEAQGGLFDPGKAHLDDFRNMLIWGDNKLVMASLLSQFKGEVTRYPSGDLERIDIGQQRSAAAMCPLQS